MEYKFLNITNKIADKSANLSNKKYQKILNNLLGINSRFDAAIFFKLSTINSDLNKLLDEKSVNKIYQNTSFKIKINYNSDDSLIDLIKNAKEPDEVIDIFQNEGINLPNTTIAKIEKNFENEKDKIIEKLTIKKNSFIAKWKKNIKMINDSYSQNNIWPLFVGFYFLESNLISKQIRAPYVLKEVEMVIEGNNVYLVSRNDRVVLNDKLSFFIEENRRINLPTLNENIDKISIEELSLELDHYFNNVFNIAHIDPLLVFEEKTIQKINNEEISKINGFCLLFCQPTGGALRRATLDLISSGGIEDVLVMENELFDYNGKSINLLIKKREKIVRICKSDASQEKAIISSLQGHSIIIGPPGTGKSQTIANILANIIYNDKKALFISQKKVALEVVIERMKDLQYFMFQMVDSNKKSSKLEKIDFYHKLKKFRSLIQDGNIENNNLPSKNLLKSFVNDITFQKWQVQEYLSKFDEFQFEIYLNFVNKYETLENEIIKNIFELNSLIIKNTNNNEIELSNVIEQNPKELNVLAFLLKIEKRKKLGIFKFWPQELKLIFEKLMTLKPVLKDFKVQPKDIKKICSLKSYQSFAELQGAKKFLTSMEHINNENYFKTFTSDEQTIMKVAKNKALQRVENVEKEAKTLKNNFLKKFLGRIERSFTPPSTFTNLFKKELKQMFNIIVSTPESLSSFVDFKKDRYDYVIFDEASQIFLEKAIPFLAISKNVIVAGDEEQMQPTNWFSQRTVANDDYLEENIDSLLTYAIANNLPKYNLELNYRAELSSLSSFSSKEFYDSNLKCLDKNNTKNQSIDIINASGKWENGANEIEAKKAIEILKDNLKKYKKIILLTLNKMQMSFIENILINEEPEIYDLIIDNKIILKNLENIQGDEADLVIVSVSYDKNTSLAGTYVGRKGGRNALNVAITRAKSKMVVIKSIYANEVRNNNEDNLDLITFKRWLNFLDLSSEKQKEYSIVENKFNEDVDSNFEKDVLNWLLRQKLNKEVEIKTQFGVGSYRIDLAIIDQRTKSFLLGIEVDGARYHSGALKRYEDIVRQDFIEAKGYRIIRINEILWKTDKEKILQMIKEWI